MKDHSFKRREVRKWIAIAVERSTTMRRHRATFAKAVAETQTAKSSEVSQDENNCWETNDKTALR